MTDNRATPATRRDEATDRLAEIEARIAATVPPPAVEVDGEMVTPLSHAHAVAIGSWPWRSDIVWLVAQLRRTKPTLRAPEVTDVERLAKIIHGASWHTCELGMDDRPLSLNTCRKIAGRIVTDAVRVAGALGTQAAPDVTDESHEHRCNKGLAAIDDHEVCTCDCGATSWNSMGEAEWTEPQVTTAPTGRADGSA